MQNAPLVEVSLEQFEEFAIDRLHVLKAVENYRLRSVQMKDREGPHALRSAAPRRTGQAEDDTAKDVLSHFFLRMAFCQTEELRRWFLTQRARSSGKLTIAAAPEMLLLTI
ncbi:hypothetical protein GQ600_23324 [Phytophthora cactorum]|nr:hypothetical protein GQ600_23324 [Phytophthora cactorum]